MAGLPSIEEMVELVGKRVAEEYGGDVAFVVRCRECKHRCDETALGNFMCGHKMLGLVRPEDFCSYGEREDGESHG